MLQFSIKIPSQRGKTGKTTDLEVTNYVPAKKIEAIKFTID